MSSSSMISSPRAERKFSRIPGEFEPQEDDDFPAQDTMEVAETDNADLSNLSALPGPQEPTSLLQKQEENSDAVMQNSTVLEEQQMNDRLKDFESSFLPEISHLPIHNGGNPGVDDTLALANSSENLAVRKKPHPIDIANAFRDIRTESSKELAAPERPPQTPPDSYKTPSVAQQEFESKKDAKLDTPDMPSTSQLENMSSSPEAARTVSRVQSLTTMAGYETANEYRDEPQSPSKKPTIVHDEDDQTPKKNTSSRKGIGLLDVPDVDPGNESTDSHHKPPSKRPRYLNSRSSQARLSYDSTWSSNTDASDATVGADYALASGGVAPDSLRQRKTQASLSRQTSLGSMLSGISGMSDDEIRPQLATHASNLSTLDEESPMSSRAGRHTPLGPVTPKVSAKHLTMPSDTVIANNVRGITVPGTIARQYEEERGNSPSKNLPAMTPGPKRGLTLKEHRSTVEKLGKENFDLKMKIYFLDQALQKRSEDGVKEMITENVQLKSDRMRLEKEAHALRKQIRELQKKLSESDNRSPSADPGYATDEERSPTAEEEVIYLRERVETTEIEIDKLRTENIAKENEKRRLAEMIRSLGDSRAGASDVGSREERDMWKDMLEAETIAREQSEEENKKLKDEIAKSRQDTFANTRSQSRKPRIGGSVISRSSSGEAMQAQNAELERLRHEVSELQKTISAQASALTSRNKEKERLYQEIEDLKLGRMGGARSVTGDSILDRSASRQRSHSRASNGTRMTRMSDEERDSLEAKINELRDEVSQLKLDNQNLQGQFDEAMAELDAVDQQAQADADQFNEELAILSQERDHALRDAEEQDQAFQQLKNEAQEEIDGLGDELDAKIEECERLEHELKSQCDNVKALQAEMRSASEGLVRLEEDAQSNLARYQSVKGELDDANRELENMEKSLTEAESKIQRLTVQQESSHNEIAFLREEQDGDKIKIGDLESLLKKVHLNLESERSKARGLEQRIEEERQQRDMIASRKEKDVQRMVTDLNRESTTAKEDLRQVRRTLNQRDIEANTFKERLAELEEGLRCITGDSNGNRQSLLSAVTKMQRDLEQTSVDLEATRRRLDERENILANRDQLLESNGLEYRKAIEALERERQGRRQDKISFEQSLKSHQQATRAMTATSGRITELESLRATDRKKLAAQESQFKDQLAERNQVLLSLWKRLSAMCGPDWAHNNSLINGNLPSQEVIGNMLFWPGFSRNILLAAKQVEGTLSMFRDKIKRVERELWKEFQSLEHTLELRTKKLERIEQAWDQIKTRQAEMEAQSAHSHGGRSSRGGRTPEISKLKGENRLLKAELQLLQQQQHRHNYRQGRPESRGSMLSAGMSNEGGAMSMDGAANGQVGLPTRSSSMRKTSRNQGFERAHTTNIIEHLANVNMSPDMNSLRSNSISSRNSAYVIQNERDKERERGLMVPAGPFNAPPNGNFSLPPREHAPMPPAPPSASSGGGGSDLGGFNTAATGPGQEKWIHRLRELERRLKAEREARLMDRSGMRRRLEERDEVNEQLRQELERERVRRSTELQMPTEGQRGRFQHFALSGEEGIDEGAEDEEVYGEQEERAPHAVRRG